MKLSKNILFLAVAAAAFSVTSCFKQETYPAYEVGEPEYDNDINFRFIKPGSTTFQLDPADPTVITFKAQRDSSTSLETLPELVVPVVLTARNGDSENIFELSELKFAAKDTLATLTINFPNAEVGTLYEASVEVTDSKYIKQYGNLPKSLSFSVQRIKWNSLGMGSYYDDLIAYWSKVAYDPVEVEILQCDTDNSLFRIMDPYTPILKAVGATPATGADAPDEYIQIKVLKKGDKVGSISVTLDDVIDFDQPSTGYIHPSYNEPIYLLHPKYFAAGADPAYWSHSKVVVYQELPDDADDDAQPLPGEIHLAPYYYMFALGGFNYSQYDDDIDIIFPGFVPTDYTIYLETDYPADGVTPIYMEVGEDVASVKYAIYEGTFGQGGADKKIETIIDGTDASTTISDFILDEDSGIRYVELGVSPEKSGQYTFVAVAVDSEGNGQAAGFVNFKYVSAEDAGDLQVDINVFTEDTPSRYTGLDKLNSFAFGVSGSDLEEVHIGIFSGALTEAKVYAVKADESGEYAVDAATLEAIQGLGGYYDIVSDLNPETQYNVVVWATNGSLEGYATASYTTEALPEVWKSLGTGSYTDDFFTTFYNIDNLTYDVEVMQSEDDPTRYKIVYPYDGKFGYNEPGDWDTSKSYDIVITIPDNDHVYITPQEIGVDWSYGMISIASAAGRFVGSYSFEVIEANNIPFGNYSDGVVTFPKNGLSISMANYNSGGWYNANTTPAFKLVLPAAAATAVSSSPKNVAKPNSVMLKGNAHKEISLPYKAGKNAYEREISLAENVKVYVNEDASPRLNEASWKTATSKLERK